ncbi:MAG: putative uridylyltransferase [Deltaproteobacteria bacterium ADurb.BinA179]|jgi:UDP-N-acetylglucosamine/UDP-N-acetylgalactosamine diphosphorylase|nr:UDPGP type 1 family protein [Deltaproteobacteria bacterium]MDI9541303.1 UDPGP type 1 family protein [Pseudomonadota bacterium]OPZ29355.1 MAG: putative uridylyltransferase [Deltaproteobacteria bacterium ADurb.BinA179]HRR69826.1 UDPGP type 1 family protein [Desulfomonilia bacterium]HOD69391.1 UDPGP type 1 family protein [Deltaproteobacteria bacterium]
MLEEKLRQLGQGHIARLLESGSAYVSRREIARDLEEIDAPLVRELIAGRFLYEEPAVTAVKPAPVIPASFSSSPESSRFRRHGETLLSQGRVAALVVAGGQGSRLGIDAPKGVVGVTPVRRKSLFQLHAEKILALSNKYAQPIPLFVMTSRANDADTKDFFTAHSFFGLNPDDVFFFVQGMLPSITPEGSFVLSREGGLFMNPDGHGGTLSALKKSGCLDTLKERGIEEIFYFQVDNPLVSICDPLFVGLHSLKGAQMSSKVVRKKSFEEKVGVIAEVEGRTRVLEYSDMNDDMRYAVDGEGEMLYWAGSIAIHMIRRDFVETLTGSAVRLPFHKALKTIPTVDSRGRPTEIQGIKFETFIFDALPMAEKSVTLEVLREREFAPVKNRTGEDSLETSRIMQSNLHRSWLEDLGVNISDRSIVEISPLAALEKDDLRARGKIPPMEVDGELYIP